MQENASVIPELWRWEGRQRQNPQKLTGQPAWHKHQWTREPISNKAEDRDWYLGFPLTCMCAPWHAHAGTHKWVPVPIHKYFILFFKIQSDQFYKNPPSHHVSFNQLPSTHSRLHLHKFPLVLVVETEQLLFPMTVEVSHLAEYSLAQQVSQWSLF